MILTLACAASSLAALPRPCRAANPVYLQGVVPTVCMISVLPQSPAMSLPLSAAAAQHILIGTILQYCNKKTGYTLVLTSANCAAGTVGAKVIDAVSGESVPYSVEMDNPTTGGSTAVVPGLLANSCSNAVGRDVLNAKVIYETSQVYANYTGSTVLAAGTYQDTLTFTLNLK